MTFRQFLRLLVRSKKFRYSLLDTLLNSEFDTYRWEMKELTEQTFYQPVEFIITYEPGLYNIYEDLNAFK